jgi:predicted ATPase
VRTLVETGVLVGERGASRLAQPVESLQMPATVQAILAARIDRLAPEDKRLLQTAAVIGTEVPWPLLHAIADAPEEALHRGLGQLQAAEFLYETSLFPEHAYYLQARPHSRSGLQQPPPGAAAGPAHPHRRCHRRALCRPSDRTGRTVGPPCPAGRDVGQGSAYCRQAGAKAETRSAYREAVAYFEQALTALQYFPEHHDA